MVPRAGVGWPGFWRVRSAGAPARRPDTHADPTVAPDTDASDVVGEWTVPVPTVEEDSAAATFEWAVVEVYEMRKPF